MYSTSYYSYNEPSMLGASSEGAGIWMIIAAVLAVIGGILTYFLFVKAKAEPKGKFLKWLKDFLAFKMMWIEPIMKVFYYIATIFSVLGSFALISTSFIAFIVMLVVVPIVIRLLYESLMMFIMIWRNTTDIAKNTEKKE
ncbi:hypothetical protein IJ135_01035 [Candidatus Saccharibacteria bacterium]|nr:hypothetical protein [Candidatus Saccharibacteria bacterium]